MFDKLFDFSYQRTKMQAFGFYLAYFILGLLIGGIISGVAAGFLYHPGLSYKEGFKIGAKIGSIVALAYNTTLIVLLMKSKKLLKNFSAVLLALTGIFFSMILGNLLGLIPTAILTTFPANTEGDS